MQGAVPLPRQALFCQRVCLLDVKTWGVGGGRRMNSSFCLDALNIQTCWVRSVRRPASLVLREQRRLLGVIRERVHCAGMRQRGEVRYDGDG
jgi:hypothetical protein